MECFSINSANLEERISPDFYRSAYRNNERGIRNTKWTSCRLKSISEKIVDGPFGSQLKVDEYVSDGIPLIRVKDIKDGCLIENGFVYITQEKQQQLRRSQVLPGDILLTKAGSIGNAAILPQHIKEANITSHLAKIKVKSGVNAKYIQEYLNTRLGRLQIFRLGNKTTRPELNLSEVESILVILPDTRTQTEIVAIMQSAYEQKKQKQQEAEALLDSINDYVLGALGIKLPAVASRKCFGVSAEAVQRKRIDPKKYSDQPKAILSAIENSQYKTKEISDVVVTSFPGEWGEDPAQGGETGNYVLCRVIRNTNFHNQFNLDYRDVAERLISVDKFKKLKVRSGDVLIEKSGGSPIQPVGRVALIENIPDNYTFSNFLQCFRINRDECLPDYLFVYLRAIYSLNYMEYLQNQTIGIKNLIMEEYLSIPVPLPPLEVQETIAKEAKRRMSKAEKLRIEAKEHLEQAKQRVEKMILGER